MPGHNRDANFPTPTVDPPRDQFYLFFYACSPAPRDLHTTVHSFPTRRSSDLRDRSRALGRARRAGAPRCVVHILLLDRRSARPEEHTSELQSHGLTSYAVF